MGRVHSADSEPPFSENLYTRDIQPIRESWSNKRYAYECTCSDGKHLRFIFTLISSVPPFRMEALSMGSDNVPDILEPSTDSISSK